jgi:3-methyladenine DNA glycosylase AlkD
MTLQEVMQELESLGSERQRKQNTKQGASDNQFGVKLGDIRKVAKKIKVDKALAMELWKTENVDARMLAVLLIKPNDLSVEELDHMVCSTLFDRVADWVNAYLVKKHKANESLREGWMNSNNPMAARAGWNLCSERMPKEADGLDISALLDRIEKEMGAAHPSVQWTMNFTLANIGIYHEAYRARALQIGEKLGIYSDYPTAKGCTSPYAPIWINEMVSRQKKA